MIYDTFAHLAQYCQPDSLLHQALRFARDVDPAQPDGRIDIDGARLFALVSSYETSPRAERRFEAHRKYFDVQALLTGEECIDVTFDHQLPLLQDYQAEKDILFVASPPEYASLPMKPGYFAIFFPQDIHRPNCQLHGKQAVRKIVMKVRAA